MIDCVTSQRVSGMMDLHSKIVDRIIDLKSVEERDPHKMASLVIADKLLEVCTAICDACVTYLGDK